MNQMFAHLVESVTVTHDIETLKERLGEIAAGFGFPLYAYVEVGAASQTVLTNILPDWVDEYRWKGYRNVDPVMKGLRERTAAFTWSFPDGLLTKKRRAFFEGSARFGIRSGISVPISCGFGGTAVMSFITSEPNTSGDYVVDPVIAAASIGQVHSRLREIGRQTPLTKLNLKAGELLCLRWSAEGKSMKAISLIEDLSYATVCFHIRNAKLALGVTTLPQATAVATALKLI